MGEQLGSAVREVEEFLFREAELADSHDYAGWMALWTHELRYSVPCEGDEIAPDRRIALIYDDRAQLEERIYRLGTKHAHSQRPRSRLSRVVSNVMLRDYHATRGGTVTARFFLVEVRGGQQEVLAGWTRHVLVREEGQLKMREKYVNLMNNVMPMRNMTYIV
jgi:3-phenylpropionate/cinnamic acid dioxygenase small subunit